MANVILHRQGEPNPIQVLAKASTQINIGDMVILQSSVADVIETAGIWSSNLAVTQAAAHDVFLGIACDQRLTSQTTAGKIQVNTTGIHEMACANDAALDVGALVGPSKGSGNTLKQQVESVATANLAIGRLAKAKAANAATCFVEIKGITQDGTQALA